MPPEVKRIHMNFALKITGGHQGSRRVLHIQASYRRFLMGICYYRKFWRECLPRLKFHNPAVPMTVQRTTKQSGPATLTIFFADSPSPDAAQSPAPRQSTSPQGTASDHKPFSRTHLVNMKRKHQPEILREVLIATQAREVQATEEETAQMRELEDQRQRSQADASLQQEVRARRKREKQLLDQARKSLEVQSG